MSTRTQKLLDLFRSKGDFYRLATELSRDYRRGTITMQGCKDVLFLKMVEFFHGDFDAIWKMACDLDASARTPHAPHYDFEMEEYIFA